MSKNRTTTKDAAPKAKRNSQMNKAIDIIEKLNAEVSDLKKQVTHLLDQNVKISSQNKALKEHNQEMMGMQVQSIVMTQSLDEAGKLITGDNIANVNLIHSLGDTLSLAIKNIRCRGDNEPRKSVCCGG